MGKIRGGEGEEEEKEKKRMRGRRRRGRRDRRGRKGWNTQEKTDGQDSSGVINPATGGQWHKRINEECLTSKGMKRRSQKGDIRSAVGPDSLTIVISGTKAYLVSSIAESITTVLHRNAFIMKHTGFILDLKDGKL